MYYSKKGGKEMSQILIDEDGNNWNVKFEIHKGKLFAREMTDGFPELMEVDLSKDRIDVFLTRK